MYLSKLELHGFKSFAERTVLHFDPGITAIVGPNGCGKSNIVDAVRWVVGEQRARILRSEKMENVIFNGTAQRRALGMSEVQLTIENTRNVLPTEYSEVQLGRRLYRSGDSEYLMNGVQCRLKDITDLFMDTGMGAGAYSVIELKMIEDILSENAEDRRRLFEEAAGITKYKLRRRQTLSKLDGTQADLTRVRDLTEEIGKRVRSLKRQAEKATKYKEYTARLHRLELALAQVEYTRLAEQERTLKAEMEALGDRIEGVSTQEAQKEAGLEELRLELVKREQALSERQRALNKHLEAERHLETERRVAEERLEGARRDVDRTRREEEAARQRQAELAQEADALAETLEAAEPALAEAQQVLDEAEGARDRTREAADAQRQRLQDLRREEQRADEARAARRRELDRLTNRLELLEQDETRTQSQRDALAESAADVEADVAAAEARVEAARSAVAEAELALEAAERTRTERQQALDEAAEARRHAERRRDAVAAEVQLLESLVSSYEEFPDAVQYLAADTAWSRDGLRTVADVLACEDAVRVALDTALGDLASCIVVQDAAEARAAVDLLRHEEKGQATFLLLDRLDGAAPPSDADVDARPLRDAVRVADPAYAPLAALLLHDWYLAGDLDAAHELAERSAGRARFVTESGEWVAARGLVHGGSRRASPSPAAGRLGRREQLADAREQLAALDAALEAQVADLEARRTALADVPHAERRRDLDGAQRALADAEKELSRVRYEAETLDRRQTELSEHLSGVAASIAQGREETGALRAAAAEAEQALEVRRVDRAAAEEAFHAAEAESRAALNRHGEASLAAAQARNRRDNLQRDLERTRQEIEALGQRAEARRQQRAELEQTIETAREALAGLEGRLEASRAAREALEEALAYAEESVRQAREAIANLEGDLRNVRRQREQLVRDENQRAVRLAEVQTRRTDLTADVAEDFDVSLPDADIEVEAGFEEPAARAEVQDLRKKIRRLGGVNELALEAYEEEAERFEFLTAQQEDLEQAESKLLETIDEINTTASERFFETYEAIEKNFSRIFAQLFEADATARLILEDPDDPLESAIEITAKPRGKRPSTIAQLSGGEKTLTAIALLFAIYLVKPSPFCILDEVDAPLDDANVERFMRLIRDFSKDTQFILVTHNKQTMEAADRLYGITMQETGVSRLVGVKFDEAMEMAG